MTFMDFLRNLLPFLVLIPASIFCYLPMHNQLHYPGPVIVGMLAGAFVVIAGLCAVTLSLWGPDYFNLKYSIALVICFVFFWRTTTAGFTKALFVFISVCCLISYIEVIAYLLEALSRPDGAPDANSPLATVYELGLCLVFGLAFGCPAWTNLSWLIDNVHLPRVWRLFLTFPVLLLGVNIYCVPISYQNLYVGQIYGKYAAALGLSLVGYVLFYILIYVLSRGMADNASLVQKNSLLSMQAVQYQKQKQYMDELSRLRHDMKHSFHLLRGLAAEGKLEALNDYLTAYEKDIDIARPTVYCKNDALNALLNYYGQMAQEAGVDCRWRIDLPEELTISEVDLCSIFGNLIENALTGCCTLPRKDRFFHLNAEPRGGMLYIVSTNSFDGTVQKKQDRYQSLKAHHTGLGLLSMQSIAESRAGLLEASNTQDQFLVNIMLKY